MSNPVAWILSAAAGALAGAAVSFAVRPATADAPSAPPPAAAPDLDALQRRIADLEQRLAETATPSRTAAAAPVDPAALRVAVEAVVGELLAGRAAPAAAAGDSPPARLGTAAEVVGRLAALSPGDAAWRELWAQADAEDRIAEVLDAVTAWAAARPGSPDAQLLVGRAFLAAGMQRPNHPNGEWWGRSDAAFSAALELDPRHWDARFEKAVSLSHWPDRFGRGPESIRHFETLIEQQRELPPEPRHAEVYLMLGNMLSQGGRDDRAREVWAEGATRFPTHDGLRTRAGSSR